MNPSSDTTHEGESPWKLRLWLDAVRRQRIERNFDALVPIVGDEGVGKSTLELQLTWLWQDILGKTPTPERVLNPIVWDQDGFKHALANYDARSAIPVPDAARVLYKKDAMNPDQKELEKDLLDSRMKEYLILLGFQDWDIIPTMLQERRAKFLLHIPRRGVVHAYGRTSLDERVADDEWPDPDMVTQFPSLEGTELWNAYRDLDRAEKESRIDVDEEDTEDEWQPQEVVEELLAGNVTEYLTKNEFNDTVYVDADLIQYDYGLSVRAAKQVKKAVTREIDVEAEWADAQGAEGEAHTA